MELEKQARGVATGAIPVVWDPSGTVRVYYPCPNTARWDAGVDPGPELFVARVAIPFLRVMWSLYHDMGLVPDLENGSAVPEPAKCRANKCATVGRMQWVMDTGSGHDLVPQQLINTFPLRFPP